MVRTDQNDFDADGGSSFPHTPPARATAELFALPGRPAWRSLWSSSPAHVAPSPVGSAHTARLGALSKLVPQRSQRRVQTLLPAFGSTGSALFRSLCTSPRQSPIAFFTSSFNFF